MTEKEKLIIVLVEKFNLHHNDTAKVADFIISDRKRVLEEVEKVLKDEGNRYQRCHNALQTITRLKGGML